MTDKIRAIREALKLSQREFGERLGVSRNVIKNIEYACVEPKEVFIQHMCEVYHVNEQWLKTGEGEMFNCNPSEMAKLNEAIRIFNSLRPEFQDCALEQLRELSELQKNINSF